MHEVAAWTCIPAPDLLFAINVTSQGELLVLSHGYLFHKQGVFYKYMELENTLRGVHPRGFGGGPIIRFYF